MTIAPLAPEHIPTCEAIARDLPAWFGREEGLREMSAALRAQRGWIARIDEATVGFITVETLFPETWEITWMAVAPAQHRRGAGRRLIETVADECRAANARLLLVKTLADQHPSPEYAQTRTFYRRVGFLPLAVLPELWGEDIPCLLLVRPLS